MMRVLILGCIITSILAHDGHDQQPLAGPFRSLWYSSMDNIPGDGGTQVCPVHHLLFDTQLTCS